MTKDNKETQPKATKKPRKECIESGSVKKSMVLKQAKSERKSLSRLTNAIKLILHRCDQ